MDEDEATPPDPEHIETLKKHFGHSEFRPTQWEIIYSILVEKRDCCAVMATGYGKSLCYQFPPLVTNGIALVISPLISLMQDQVLNLEVAGISAVMMGAAQTAKATALNGILDGSYRVVYVTPEWCLGDLGESVLKQLADKEALTLIAVDEAHCVSQWGFDFRPKYRNLGRLRKLVPNVPILAVTATATPQVRKDICLSLCLRNTKMVVTSFDRPNLYFSVRLKDPDKDIVSDLERLMVKDQLVKKFPGPTIIYCPTKKMTEKVAEALSQSGINCGVYHADLTQKVRREVHQRFVRDMINVVVATVAFGMGIDKPDVRTIIHYGAPKEIESYYQEVGRAGRDGLPSTCHVFYNPVDYSVNKHFLSSLSGTFREHREKMFKLLQQYLETDQCRRRMIVQFFNKDEMVDQPSNKRCCDNCSKNKILMVKRPEIDLREDTRKLLGAVKVLGGRFGLGVPIKLLLGKADPKIPNSLTRNSLFGSGKEDPEKWWKALGRLLVREGLLEEKAVFTNNFQGKFRFPISTTDITDIGKHFLSSKEGEEPTILIPTPEITSLGGRKIRLAAAKAAKEKIKKITQDRLESSDTEIKHSDWPSSAVELSQAVTGATSSLSKQEILLQNKLYESLLVLRGKLAADTDCMPYMIANNKTLLELARLRPSTKEQLVTVEGFPQVKVDKFGKVILDHIKEMVEELKEKDWLPSSSSTDISQEKTHPASQTPSFAKPKVETTKSKGILYDDEEEVLPAPKVKEGSLWDDEIDDSYLADVLDNPKPLSIMIKPEEESSTVKADVWGSEDDSWLLENQELENSLIKLEAGEVSYAASSTQGNVKVTKKRVCYESDEDHETFCSSKKGPTSYHTEKLGATTKQKLNSGNVLEKSKIRKKKLKSLFN